MLLEIQYQNSTRRRINLHPSFFAPVDYKRNSHIPESTTSKRAIDIAFALDANPTFICLTKDGEIVFKKAYEYRGDNGAAIIPDNHKQAKKDARKAYSEYQNNLYR